MPSLRICLSLSAVAVALPTSAMADVLPAPVGEISHLAQIHVQPVSTPASWTVFLQPVVTGEIESAPVSPFGGLPNLGLPPIEGGGPLFGEQGPAEDLLPVGGIVDGASSAPVWPVEPGRITGIDPGSFVGPGAPSGDGEGGGLVIVPLPSAALAGIAVLAGWGGISGVRTMVRRRL